MGAGKQSYAASWLAGWRAIDPTLSRFLGIVFLFNLGNSSDVS